MPFFEKELSTAGTTRTNLHNDFLQKIVRKIKALYKTNEILCLSFKKNEKENLKLQLKICRWNAGKNEIHLIKNGEIFKNESINCRSSRWSFFNIVYNLDTTHYSINKPFLAKRNLKIWF